MTTRRSARPDLKPTFAPRVVVTGSECTGKTTLASALASSFGAALSEEYSRRYAEERHSILGPQDVEPIARGQIAAEDRARAEGKGLVVHDTDLVSTLVYARHYYGECPPWIVEAARERRAGLYLLCHPDIPWTADGIRDRGERRQELHDAFREALAEIGAVVAEVRGSKARRWRTARAAVSTLVEHTLAHRPGR